MTSHKSNELKDYSLPHLSQVKISSNPKEGFPDPPSVTMVASQTITNGRPIKVCMFPKYVPINESIGLMSDAIERTGHAKISNYRYLASLFRRADLFHVHWPDDTVFGSRIRQLIKVAFFLSYVLLCKLFGRPIVWHVHNIGAHEKGYLFLEKLVWNVFLPRVDWTIHYCPASLKAIYRLTDSPPPGTVIPHPHFRSVYGPLGAAVDPRRRLGLATDAFVLSSFGLIRPYKGFENLIKVFRNWNDESSMLHIAGEPMFPQVANELENLSAGDAHICLDLRSLTRLELRDLVYASDVIVLPYKKMMNSGVAVAALSLGCPILGPAAGCILDFHERLGPDWVLMFNDELSVDDLERARRSFRKRDRSKMPNLSWMEPDIIGENILQVYQQLTQIK